MVLNLQLRAYATHQGQTSNGISREEIAFVLNTNHIYQNLSSSYIVWVWGVNVLAIMITVLFSMYYSKDFNNSVTKILDDQTEVVITVLVIGMLLMLAEIVATTVQLVDDSGTDYSQTTMIYYISYHIIILILTIISLCVVFILSVIIMFRWKFKRSAVIFKSRKLLIYIFSGLFLTHICYYALPTFLFLLVYPIQVIVVATYFISYIFSITLFSAVSIDVSKKILRNKICGHSRKPGKIILVTYVLLFFLYPVLDFAIMFLFLYLLMLSRASVITTTPNTFLSLLPTAAISAISWMLRKKFMNTRNTDTDITAGDMETISRHSEPDTVNSELIPLLSAV